MHYFTTKGDGGTTKLFSCPKNSRVSKGNAILEVLGGVDELNSFLGLCRAMAGKARFSRDSKTARQDIQKELAAIQEELFIIQAELGGAGKKLSKEKIERLETDIEMFADRFPKISSFIIPGAIELGAVLDVARTVARRVERLYVRNVKSKNTITGAYLNRLSSLLYVLARFATHAQGVSEKSPTYL